MLEDYLGWDYAYLVAAGLFIPWLFFIFIYRKKRKRNPNKKWWFWTITAALLIHLFFVQYINPTYFGLGTPDYFTQIKVTDENVILFDNEMTYLDDERSGTEDYTSHLRIHVVDRMTHEKRYSKLIGDNYSTILDENGIYLIENSMYQYASADNVVAAVYEFDIETQVMKKIIDNTGTITVEGEDIKVFEIEALYRIDVKSDQGEMYRYNSYTKSFEPKENSIVNNETKPVSYFLNTAIGNMDKKELIIDNKGSDKEFLQGKIVDSYTQDSSSYVLIKWFKDLTKSETKFSLVSSKGDIVWSTNLRYFEKSAEAEGFEDIQQFTFKDDDCYITINEYLFELDLLNGRVNWNIKL